MGWPRGQYYQKIKVKGITKKECLKRVLELERKGWECIPPGIKQVVYDNHYKANTKYYSPGYHTNIEWITYMKRVDKDGK